MRKRGSVCQAERLTVLAGCGSCATEGTGGDCDDPEIAGDKLSSPNSEMPLKPVERDSEERDEAEEAADGCEKTACQLKISLARSA